MKKFSTEIKGYNKKEVNDFVLNVTKEYESILNRLKQAEQELALVKEKNKKYEDMETTLNRAILIASESSNQLKKLAHDEYNRIIEDAKKNASRLINEALEKVEKIEGNATSLQHRINIYSRKIRQTMQEQIDYIDEINKIDF